MDVGLAIIAGAAGLIGYKVVTSNGKPDPNQPNGKQPQSFWNSWMEQGDMPSTGNGPPTTDQTGHDVAQVTTAVAKFATSLIDYFGTSQNDNATGGGTSTGGPTSTYGDGGGQDW